MNDAAHIITAIVGGATALGGAGRFVWLRVEQRFAAIEAKLDACAARERANIHRSSVQLTVIELLWAEVKRISPDADVLSRAKRLLDGLKRVQFDAERKEQEDSHDGDD